MRTVILIFAGMFVVASVTIAGSSDGTLPGIGTFHYSGSPVDSPAPQRIAAQ